MTMKLTDNQRQASEIRTNCVVSAGAGSGKTGVLSTRFKYLVQNNLAHCNEILTITFTRKATSEMKDRIYKNIVALNRPEELELFADATISTVDAFCSQIARTDCERYGITSDFTMLDADDYRILLEKRAYRFILRKFSEECVKTLLQYVNPDQISQLLAETTDRFFSIVSSFNPESQARNYLDFALSMAEKRCNELVSQCNLYINLFKDDSLLKTNVQMLTSFVEGKTDASKIEFDRSLGKAENRAQAKAVKDTIKTLVSDLSFYSACSEQKDFVFGFYNLLAGFVKEVNAYKQKTSQLVFADVMALSLDILKKNKSVRSFYKNKFRYIMIDEFQDNNDDYRKLLYFLSEKKDVFKECPESCDVEDTKIFLVGDQKQSIYRFRGADVSVFKKMESEIALTGGRLIELDKNFRSTPALVKFFNKVFPLIMKNNGQKYEADFAPLEYEETKEDKTRIVFHEYLHESQDSEDKDLASTVQSEAYSIANLVYRMLNTDDFLVGGKRPKAHDIAILFRQTSNQGAFEKALRLKGIAYSIKSTRALTQEALVNDFYNALQLCIYPNDKLTAMAFENSPLNQDLSSLKKVMTCGSIASCISFIWNKMGYRNFIISNPANSVYQEHYLWLLSLADNYDRNSKTIVEFLDYLRPLLGSASKIKELTVQTEDHNGVQLMTIHASKGLQFPIVILASMEAGDSTVKEKLVTSKEKDNIYLPCNLTRDGHLRNVFDHANLNLEASMEDAELKRLFYVALTRAQTHLVLSTGASLSKLEDKKDNKVRKTNLAKLFLDACPFESLENLGMEIIHFERINEEETYSKGHLSKALLDRAKPYYKAEPDSFDYSKDHVGVTELSPKESSSGERLPALDSDEIIRRHELQTEFGTLVHYLIECGIKKTYPNQYFNAKLSLEELEMLVSDAKTLSETFLSSALFQSLNGMEINSERSFMFYDKDTKTLVEGAIDLYAVGKDEVKILDFKTDLYMNPEIHKSQLGWYTKALRSIYPDKKVTAQVVYLRNLYR